MCAWRLWRREHLGVTSQGSLAVDSRRQAITGRIADA
jgi:hypothetical protein